VSIFGATRLLTIFLVELAFVEVVAVGHALLVSFQTGKYAVIEFIGINQLRQCPENERSDQFLVHDTSECVVASDSRDAQANAAQSRKLQDQPMPKTYLRMCANARKRCRCRIA
jgi:hypothetical protein